MEDLKKFLKYDGAAERKTLKTGKCLKWDGRPLGPRGGDILDVESIIRIEEWLSTDFQGALLIKAET